ncbi:N-acetylmuramoyl-L-alanine amidase [Ornithinibacillus sp. 4-3]|uniref:N-acetylmuramoyl-L-alanine amidase n=1 Tax=Ornithinibacillus sp. 4-3 TaxID=3231488 RepID=A0AB39HMZ7_9BACI
MTVWKNDYIKINKHSRPGLKLTAHKKGIIHYTANHGGTATNHQKYFNNLSGRYASAHIFVDKKEAICIIPLDEVAYAANDGSYSGVPELKPNANYLSISVEMCQEKDGSFHPNTISRTEDVFVELSKMYGWDPLKDIVRHYDVTHKNCPAPWVSNPNEFIDFKNRVNAKLKGEKSHTVKQPDSKTAGVSTDKASKPKAKSISQMVQEVIDGKHGNGHDNRRKSLGINQAEYDKVRAEVNRRAGSTSKPAPKKSITQMVNEVLSGNHGNGHSTRQKSLGISKAEYDKVKSEVNKRLMGAKSTYKSVSQMATEVIQGKHGSGHENRRKSLGISQAQYNKVRAEVNKKLK